jgi:hypothetical protein
MTESVRTNPGTFSPDPAVGDADEPARTLFETAYRTLRRDIIDDRYANRSRCSFPTRSWFRRDNAAFASRRCR